LLKSEAEDEVPAVESSRGKSYFEG